MQTVPWDVARRRGAGGGRCCLFLLRACPRFHRRRWAQPCPRACAPEALTASVTSVSPLCDGSFDNRPPVGCTLDLLAASSRRGCSTGVWVLFEEQSQRTGSPCRVTHTRARTEHSTAVQPSPKSRAVVTWCCGGERSPALGAAAAGPRGCAGPRGTARAPHLLLVPASSLCRGPPEGRGLEGGRISVAEPHLVPRLLPPGGRAACSPLLAPAPWGRFWAPGPKESGAGVCTCRAVRSKVSLLTPNKAAPPGVFLTLSAPTRARGSPSVLAISLGPWAWAVCQEGRRVQLERALEIIAGTGDPQPCSPSGLRRDGLGVSRFCPRAPGRPLVSSAFISSSCIY